MRQMKTFATLALAVAASLVATGCANDGSVRKEPTYEQAAKNPFVPTTYKAADMLLAQLQGRLSLEQPLIVATTVSIDALEKSSTLGRLVSEQVSARFAQNKFRMIEMKFRNNVYMLQGQGELMLTREIRDIATSHSAQAVVVGTYAESNNFVFVNLKVVDPNTNVALAVHDFALPLDEDVRKMIRSR